MYVHKIKMKNQYTKFKIIFTLLIFGAVFLLPKISSAATYYIDHDAGSDSNGGTSTSAPWQHCPGMYGWTGFYTHATGDTFVFKGGVTWTRHNTGIETSEILIIANSGTNSSNPDVYMSGQRCGQSGSVSCNGGVAWGTGYPIFDGETKYYSIYASNKSNITIDGLKSYNNGLGNRGFTFLGGTGGIEVKNCWFQTGAVNALDWGPRNVNASKFWVHDNYFIQGLHAFFAGPGTDGYTYDDVRFYNNIVQGVAAGTELGGSHPDGIQIQGPASFVFTNTKIYNNQFRGVFGEGMTAVINLQWHSGLEIYNNLIAFENTTDNATNYLAIAAISLGYMDSQHDENVKIYNNTISSDANYTNNKGWKFGIIVAGNQGVVDIKNNIFSNCEYDMLITRVGTTVTSDYNFFNNAGRGRKIWDYTGANIYDAIGASSAVCSTLGWECHSVSGDPKFTTLPTGTYLSGDFSLQSSSTAKDSGTNLEVSYNADINNISRPQGSAWDIGAYEYAAASPPPDTTPPAAPTGVSII